MKKLLLSFLLLYVIAANAQILITPGVTKEALVASFAGAGAVVSNISISGASNAYGTFSNGNTTNLGITEGAILTTGSASKAGGQNASGSLGDCNGLSGGDPTLLAVQPSATEDATVLEFDIIPHCNQLSISFVFGSEEYPEFVGASYNDVFGVFLSGPGPACQAGYYNSTNIATLPDNVTPVSIDNVNGGTNSSYYVNNIGGSSIQYDGFTKKITRNINVCPCQTYHLKIAIADAGDCYYDSGVFINLVQCNNPLNATITANQTCASSNNGSATVTATGTGPFIYSWSPAPGGGQGTATATGLTGGVSYTVTINDGLACSPAITRSITIPVITIEPAIVSQTDVFCNGGTNGSAKISTSGGTAPYTYSWTPSGGTGATASNLKAGSYTVTATDANGCSGSKTITIGEPDALSISNSSQTNVSCFNGTNGSATVTVAGGTPNYIYSWAPSGGISASASGLAEGTYTVTIKDANNCQLTQNFTITQPTAALSVSNSSQTNVSCFNGANGSAIVTVAGGTPNYVYSWTPSGGANAEASGLTKGTYTVTITDANSCSETKSFVITEPDLISKSQVLTICANESVKVGNNTYTVSGDYTDILVAKNGCDSTVYTDLTVNAPIDTPVLIGENTLEALSGTSYQWLDCDAGMSVIDGATNYSFTPVKKDASYAVIVYDNGCSDTSSCDRVLLTSIDNKMVESVKVYPNPSSGIFTLSGLKSNSTLHVYTMQGSLIKELFHTDSNAILDISEEQSGLYFIKVTHQEYDTFMLKVNKQ